MSVDSRDDMDERVLVWLTTTPFFPFSSPSPSPSSITPPLSFSDSNDEDDTDRCSYDPRLTPMPAFEPLTRLHCVLPISDDADSLRRPPTRHR